MADVVKTQVLFNGSRLLTLLLTSVSDGTGEAAVLKVDASAYSCSDFRIRHLSYNIQGMSVALLRDATAPVVIAQLSGIGKMDFRDIGGLANDAGAGKTGDILLTTDKASAGDSYAITIDMVKVD